MLEAESHYRDLLAKQVDGQVEVRLPFGRADVLTDTTVYEVEPTRRWRLGAAQALQYAAQIPQRGALALYGNPEALADAYSELEALPPPRIELWWLDGERFVRVDSLGQACSYVPTPVPEPGPAQRPRWVPPHPAQPSAVPASEVGTGPLPTHNSMGFEIWHGQHLPNGEMRPELRGLSMREKSKLIVQHAPDFSPEIKKKIRTILWGSG
jgi:hypothetical protein